jgi:hypothetical protein
MSGMDQRDDPSDIERALDDERLRLIAMPPSDLVWEYFRQFKRKPRDGDEANLMVDRIIAERRRKLIN